MARRGSTGDVALAAATSAATARGRGKSSAAAPSSGAAVPPVPPSAAAAAAAGGGPHARRLQRRLSDSALVLGPRTQLLLQGQHYDRLATGLVDVVARSLRASDARAVVRGFLSNRSRVVRDEGSARQRIMRDLQREAKSLDEQVQEACERQDFDLAGVLDRQLVATRAKIGVLSDGALRAQQTTQRGREVVDSVEHALDETIAEQVAYLQEKLDEAQDSQDFDGALELHDEIEALKQGKARRVQQAGLQAGADQPGDICTARGVWRARSRAAISGLSALVAGPVLAEGEVAHGAEPPAAALAPLGVGEADEQKAQGAGELVQKAQDALQRRKLTQRQQLHDSPYAAAMQSTVRSSLHAGAMDNLRSLALRMDGGTV
eukprot:g8154.t1